MLNFRGSLVVNLPEAHLVRMVEDGVLELTVLVDLLLHLLILIQLATKGLRVENMGRSEWGVSQNMLLFGGPSIFIRASIKIKAEFLTRKLDVGFCVFIPTSITVRSASFLQEQPHCFLIDEVVIKHSFDGTVKLVIMSWPLPVTIRS